MANPFVHVELHTSDVAKAREFYTRLFDWKLQDVPMPGGGGTYTMIDVGKGVGGGMQTKPMPNAPVGWLSYVEVVLDGDVGYIPLQSFNDSAAEDVARALLVLGAHGDPGGAYNVCTGRGVSVRELAETGLIEIETRGGVKAITYNEMKILTNGRWLWIRVQQPRAELRVPDEILQCFRPVGAGAA